MKKQILAYILMSLTLVASFFAWFSIGQAIRNDGSTDWIFSVVWFSVVFVFFCLDIIIIKERATIAILFFISLFLSFIFAMSFFHIPAFIIGFLSSFWAIHRIKGDMETNIKIDIWKSLRLGKILLVISLALVTTSQYYFEAKDSSAEELVPKINTEGFGGDFIEKLTKPFLPGTLKGEEDGLTVDEFILNSQKEDTRGGIDPITIDDYFGAREKGEISGDEKISEVFVKEMEGVVQEKLILSEGRKKISEIAGSEISGDEKISDVMMETINKKIMSFMRPDTVDPEGFSFVPAVLALFLFLSIFSIGSFLSPVGVSIVYLLFVILVKINLISIKKVPVEMEIIEYD